MRRPDLIVIHCAATPNGRAFHASDIRRWHTSPRPEGRGWRVPGYHYVLPVEGGVEELVRLDDDDFLEPWEIANGAHGYNGRSVHVCLIGTDRFSLDQWAALESLTDELAARYPGARIIGHREINPHKTCPGFDVAYWLANECTPDQDHILDMAEAA